MTRFAALPHSANSKQLLEGLTAFYQTPLSDVLTRCLTLDPKAHVLEIFDTAARRVPAYRRFLETRGVSPENVQTLADFRALPVTTKENYHRASDLAELCLDGELAACDMLAVSSGSTGEPTVWPRFVSDELGTAARFEQVFADAFAAEQQSSLVVVCFALGTWVGGMYTTACARHLAAKGYRLTVVTPGNQKPEILRVLRTLAAHYDQIVLCGYPPFLKDLIDEGNRSGFAWAEHCVRLVLAGEVFSESWRRLVTERLGASDPTLTSASLYGTADGGVLANETPLSISIRRFLAEHPLAARQLFGESRLPTLCQYDPFHRYFEVEPDGSLLFSAAGSVPLLRYKILDRGGIIPYREVLRFLREYGFSPQLARPARELPFVFVFGRSNFAISFYGANVYPENVAPALEQTRVAAFVTGKFVMQIEHDAEENASLQIAIELARGVRPEPERAAELAILIRSELEHVNSEFANYVPAERRTPRILLLPEAEPDYFPTGVKHRYTRGE